MPYPRLLGPLLIATLLSLTTLSCNQRQGAPAPQPEPTQSPAPAAPPSQPAPTPEPPAPPPPAAPVQSSAATPPPRHLHHAAPGRNPGRAEEAALDQGSSSDQSQAAAVQPTASAASAPTTEDQLADTLAHLPKGNMVYNPPAQMKLNQTIKVTALIGSSEVALSTLQAAMPQQPAQPIQSALTPVTPQMKVTLTSADFTITPLSSDSQIVAGPTPTTWEWQITPKHSGQLELHLAAVVQLNGLSKDFTTVDRQIAVAVDPADAVTTFIQTNWQWLIASGIAAIGALYKLYTSRKKSPTG